MKKLKKPPITATFWCTTNSVDNFSA